MGTKMPASTRIFQLYAFMHLSVSPGIASATYTISQVSQVCVSLPGADMQDDV